MSDLLQLYTMVNYVATGEPVTFSAFVCTTSGYLPIDTLTPEFTANFNDYTASSYVCTYTDNVFTYAYNTDLNPVTIQLSANLPANLSGLVSKQFDILRVDPALLQTDFDVSRISPQSIVKLPYNEVYIPTNEWAISNTYNEVVNQLYANFEYLIDLCKTYNSAPTKFIGWGNFASFIPNACFEISATQITTNDPPLYGVVGNTDKVVKLNNLSSNDYENGTSLFQVITAVSKNFITATNNLSSVYCSNIVNKGVHFVSGNKDITTFTATVTNVSFTHTVIDYPLKDSSGNSVTPVLDSYLVIKSCSNNKLIPQYTLSGTVFPINANYTPKTIDWHLKDQFNYAAMITADESFTPINDLTIANNKDLYVARGSFIEKYNIETPINEMIYTTESIDISEIYSNAKSVGISSDNKVYMLDNTRHMVHIYQVDPIIGKIYSIGDWGTLGGPTAKQGFYRPNQLFVHDDKVYVCDSGNKVVKRYSLQGNWDYTFSNILSAGSTDTIITACVDINSNLHVVTNTSIIKISNQGIILQTTDIAFDTKPVKVVTNYDGGLLYICCEKQVYRVTLDHEVTNSFANLTPFNFPYVNAYTSIAVDSNGSLYLTDGEYIFKYLDIPDVLQIRSKVTNYQFWSKEQIYVDPTELVDEWVYNRSLRRMAENIDILYKSLENKLIPDGSNSFKLAPFDDKDTGYFVGLPVSLDEFCTIGINEFVTPEVINRCIDNIQQNIFYVLCIILNCFTSTPAGLAINFVVMPPTLPSCCWSWNSRVAGKCCTPWYWLTNNVTWVHAENKNNVVVLSGGWFAVPTENATALNRINPNIALSFWISSRYFNPTGHYNLLGFSNTSITNPGVMIEVSGKEFVANINGQYFYTTGSAMHYTTADLTHVVFNKYDSSSPKCEFYINSIQNVQYDYTSNVPKNIAYTLVPVDSLTYPSDTFMFGDSSVPAGDSFIGYMHDIWLFKTDLTSTQIQSLSSKPEYWQIPSSWRRNAKAHWYANSKYGWIDDVNSYDASIYGGGLTTINDLLGSCCNL